MTPASRTALALAAVALALLGGCATAPVPPAPPAPPAPSAPAEPDETGGAGNASAAPADAGGEGYTNTVRWTTASEVDNFGFDVFRSESEDGPFERLNDEVIEGAGTTDEPHRYRFVDDTIDPRKTYFYYVESISMAGVRERFTPVGKAPPKLPPEGEEPEP